MVKIKGWEKLQRNKNGDQWYKSRNNPGYMVGVNKVHHGVHKGEWAVYIVNVNYAFQTEVIGYNSDFDEAKKIAIRFMLRNPVVRTI